MEYDDSLEMYRKDPALLLSQNQESVEIGMRLAREIYRRAEEQESEELDQMIQEIREKNKKNV